MPYAGALDDDRRALRQAGATFRSIRDLILSTQTAGDPVLANVLEQRMLQKELSRIHDVETLLARHKDWNAFSLQRPSTDFGEFGKGYPAATLGDSPESTGDTLKGAIEELRRITLG